MERKNGRTEDENFREEGNSRPKAPYHSHQSGESRQPVSSRYKTRPRRVHVSELDRFSLRNLHCQPGRHVVSIVPR